MRKTIVLIFLCLLPLSCIYSQSSPEDIYSGRIWRKNTSIGLQTGSGFVMMDRNLAGYGIAGIFLHIPISRTMTIKPQLTFLHKKHYWNDYYFNYMGTQYIAQDAQLWNNYSFNIAISQKIIPNAYAGIGLSAERIRLHSIDHEKNSFSLSQPDLVIISGDEVKKTFVKPAAFITGTAFIKLNDQWAVIVEPQIKFIFIGSRYGDFGDTKMFCTVLVGIGYGVH